VRTEAFTDVEASPDSLWDGLMRGTVRMSALVLGRPEATRTRIRAAFDGHVWAYETGRAPGPAGLGEARFRV
jgi:hypothetical protein